MWVKPCTSDPEPGVVEETFGIKEQDGNENDLEPSTTMTSKPKAIAWQIFRERYPKQFLYFVNTNGKLGTKQEVCVHDCSDLTCSKKCALTQGPKGGGGD